jgi:hypothetical protein
MAALMVMMIFIGDIMCMEYKETVPPLLINIEPTSKDEGIDLEELERDTRNLQDDLHQLDPVEKVDLVTKGEDPIGSKAGGEIVAWGSLLATLGTSALSTVIPPLVNALQSWLMRHEKRKITLVLDGDKLEVTNISDQEQQKLINAWLGRHI